MQIHINTLTQISIIYIHMFINVVISKVYTILSVYAESSRLHTLLNNCAELHIRRFEIKLHNVPATAHYDIG